MSELEEGDPPKDLADWPGGKAKYLTYGGPDGGESYDDGATSKLGPSSLRHHEDGSVTIEGEEVDDPDEYKGEPIPGGPSDPDAPPDPAMVGEEEERLGRRLLRLGRRREGFLGAPDLQPPRGVAGVAGRVDRGHRHAQREVLVAAERAADALDRLRLRAEADDRAAAGAERACGRAPASSRRGGRGSSRGRPRSR